MKLLNFFKGCFSHHLAHSISYGIYVANVVVFGGFFAPSVKMSKGEVSELSWRIPMEPSGGCGSSKGYTHFFGVKSKRETRKQE